MTIQLATDENLGMAFITCEGRIRFNDLASLYDSLSALDLNVSQALCDFSSADLTLQTEDIRVLACKKPIFKRLAIVAPHPHAYGLSRMYELFSGNDRQMRVCKDRDEAYYWLTKRTVGRAANEAMSQKIA